jgi:glycosyltransferase involved in cell wall biosynthesis
VTQAPDREPTVAFLSSYPPRRCGLATFTRDLYHAVASQSSRLHQVVAVDEPGALRRYAGEVRWRLPQSDLEAHRHVAEALNRSVDVLCLQHEYGLYGGAEEAPLLALLDRLEVPVVTTFHTVERAATADVHALTHALCERSAIIVVPAQAGVPVLAETCGAGEERVRVIPHGAPFVGSTPSAHATARAALGLSGRVLLTFGLLRPNRGVEHAIRALPSLVDRHPDLLYVVLGATHPDERRRAGEAYRRSLERLVRDLGLDGHARLDDRYVRQDELFRWLAAADVSVLPYLEPEQIVSGTLAYAIGAGNPIVATRFPHAVEVLSGGLGELVPFGEPAAIAAALDRLLHVPATHDPTGAGARSPARAMRWAAVARAYRDAFTTACGADPARDPWRGS